MASSEVGDFIDVNQFLPGRSAYECVAYAASLIKFAGRPGQGPTGTPMQASNLAQYYYGKMEGSNLASNTNGMSVAAMETMLTGMGLVWTPQPTLLASIKLSLATGRACLICGAETGFFDMGLGDRVPYNWTPIGNHAIVVSGVAPDGNLLVHDTANVDTHGIVRSGPRIYDASKMQLVSVTAVQIGDTMQPLSMSDLAVAKLFKELSPTAWQSIATGCVIHDGFLANYIANGQASLDYLGDVVENEKPQGNGKSMQRYAKGVRFYDNNVVSSIPIYGKTGEHPLGEDPLVLKLEDVVSAAAAANMKLQAQLTALQSQPPPVLSSGLSAVELAALETFVATFGKKIV